MYCSKEHIAFAHRVRQLSTHHFLQLNCNSFLRTSQFKNGNKTFWREELAAQHGVWDEKKLTSEALSELKTLLGCTSISRHSRNKQWVLCWKEEMCWQFYQQDMFAWNLLGTWNLELGTWNLEFAWNLLGTCLVLVLATSDFPLHE